MGGQLVYGLRGLSVKKKLTRGEPILAVGLWYPDPLVAETVAGFDVDVLVLDMEHGPWSIDTVSATLAATSSSSAAVVIRPGGMDRAQIQLLMDLGVDGWMVAHCDDLDTARRAVAWSKYPPLGKRRIGPTRAGGYLSQMPDYIHRSNEATLLWLQVEAAVPDTELEAMLTLRGVDALLLGPCDIAASLGYPAKWDHPKVAETIEQTVAVARRLGRPFGVPGQSLDGQLIYLSASDIGALRRGLEEAIAEWKAGRRASGHSI